MLNQLLFFAVSLKLIIPIINKKDKNKVITLSNLNLFIKIIIKRVERLT